MKFKLSWLNDRKSIIFAALIEFSLFIILFLNTFKNSILNKSILILLCLVGCLIWSISSYIVGRYSYIKCENIYVLINVFFKSFLNIFINIFLTQFLFRLFWNWNYMNFESFSNFLNDFSSFYLRIFLIASLTQFFINLFSSLKNTSKSIWLFMGSLKRQQYLKEIIGLKSKFDIKFFEQEYLSKKKFNIKGIIIDDDEIVKKKNMQFLFDLNNKGIKFMKISNWCERYLNRFPSELVKTSEIIDGNFLYIESSFRARIKRIGESILSLIIILLTLPILILSALLIKLEDGGPIFYSQIRNGFEGNQFRILKLRTMIINAEKEGIQWAKNSDQRITKIGRTLRKLRLDELPQLLLVISGEMSLIGPRPERPKIDNLLREHLPNYDLRYSIKPGISGWAQVNYPYGSSIEDSKYKLSYDIYYIKNFSILLDCIIFFKTIRLVLNGKGSTPKKDKSFLNI